MCDCEAPPPRHMRVHNRPPGHSLAASSRSKHRGTPTSGRIPGRTGPLSSERRVAMIGDSDARGPAIESGEAGDRKFEGRSAMIATDRAGTKRILLGGVAALLLVAAAAYYFADRREGADVAMPPSPENPPAVTAPRPPESG